MNLAAATDEHLAIVSNTLIYSAMAVYTLAFFAFIAEWLFGSRSKVGRTAAALTAGAATKAASGPAVTVKRAGGTAVLQRPQVVVRSAAGSRAVPDGHGAHGGTEKGDLYGRIAVSLTVLAFAIEAGGVVCRALSVKRAPWGNMYEFNITLTTVAVGVYLVLLALRKNVRWLGLPLATTVLLDLGLAVTVLYTASDQLVPALHSYWLYIHVSTAIFCGAVFYVGAVGTLLYLFKDSFESKLAAGGTPGRFANSVLDRLPSAASLDKFAYRVNAAELWRVRVAVRTYGSRPGAGLRELSAAHLRSITEASRKRRAPGAPASPAWSNDTGQPAPDGRPRLRAPPPRPNVPVTLPFPRPGVPGR